MRVWLSLCLTTLCLLALSACSASEMSDYGRYNNPGAQSKRTTSDGGAVAPKEPPPQQQDGPKAPKYNPWVDTAKDNLSTFAVDVDTGSYSFARRSLQETRRLPDPFNVRVEEFINYFDYKYANPSGKFPFNVDVDGTISPYKKDRYFLRVGVQGRRLSKEERKPMHLTFLIDTSCSMSGPDRLEMVKKSINVLLGQLHSEDTVAVATYAGGTRKVLAPTPANKTDKIRDSINALRSGGGTAMGSGMQIAYQMASDSFVKGHINRVIVFSDGDANIGRTNHDDILKTIEEYVNKGITMTTVGFGMGNYRDHRMEQLANKGNGNSFYIDSLEEAERVFKDKFIPNMVVIAKDVKIQVEFNKKFVAKYRLLGYENRDIADKDFRNDKVDAGELGAGHNVTALYELQLKKEEIAPLMQNNRPDPLVTVRLRYKKPGASKEDKASEIAQPVPVDLIHRPFDKTPWNLRWATVVATFAEILRDSPHTKDITLQKMSDLAGQAAQKDDKYQKEFLELVNIAKGLK